MKCLLGVLAVSIAAGSAVVGCRYQADLSATRARLVSGSRVVETRCGPVEVAERGHGPAVLLVHGSGGGYSQLQDLAVTLAARGYRAVSMSRFGYLRTPMPADPSPEAQADAHACLLDSLGIAAASIIGVSAGAPSSLQFCIRHPDRCTSLVLLVPATHVPNRAPGQATPPSPLMQAVLDHVLAWDFLVWSVIRLAPGVLVETALATPTDVFEAADPVERQRAMSVMREIFPVSLRTRGLQHDTRTCSALPLYALERIRAPTLALSVADDLYGTDEAARFTASRISGARLVILASGGHLWLGHDAEVQRQVTRFLEGHAFQGINP